MAGAGIVQFPEALLRPFIVQGKLVTILPEFAPSPTELNIIWPRSYQLLPSVRFIIDELVSLADRNIFG